MKYAVAYEIADAMKYAAAYEDLFYFTFCRKVKYFIIRKDYFIWHKPYFIIYFSEQILMNDIA